MSEREQIIKSMEETRKQMAILSDLLTKDQERLEAVQEAGSWKPKYRDEYWFVNDDGTVDYCRWDGDDTDTTRYDFGNCFQTELEAKRHAAKMKFMFRRCPEIGNSDGYLSITSLGSIATISGSNEFARKACNHGVVFKNYKEAEEWLPLYKFAFLGGDCPEGF